jgi:hypothetical protein
MSEDKITEPSATIEPFKQDTDKWEIYQIQLEEYFIAQNITDDKHKKNILFHVAGPEICSLLRRLFDPVDPVDGTISFSLICCVLNSYYGSLREDTDSKSNDAETEESEKAKKIAKTVAISVGVGLAVGGLTVVAAPFIAGAALTAVGFGSGGDICTYLSPQYFHSFFKYIYRSDCRFNGGGRSIHNRKCGGWKHFCGFAKRWSSRNSCLYCRWNRSWCRIGCRWYRGWSYVCFTEQN